MELLEKALLHYTGKTSTEIIKIYTDFLELSELQKNCPHDTLAYDSSYEMRTDEMHCVKCRKSGSQEELQPNRY